MDGVSKEDLLAAFQQVLAPIHSELTRLGTTVASINGEVARLGSKIDQTIPSAFLHVECGSNFSPLSASDEEKVLSIVQRLQSGEEFEDLTEDSFCR